MRAVAQDVAQAIHGLDLLFGGGSAQQAQALLLVDAGSVALDQGDGEGRHGAGIAGICGLAIPAHGLGLVAPRATAVGRHAPQSIHDVRVAAVGEAAQHLQEVAVVGRDPPHLDIRLAARRHRRHALAQIGDAGDDPAVQAHDDVAEADTRPGGRAAIHGMEQQRAVAAGEAERESQRQLQRLHFDP